MQGKDSKEPLLAIFTWISISIYHLQFICKSKLMLEKWHRFSLRALE
jgi:hypothetical protein